MDPTYFILIAIAAIISALGGLVTAVAHLISAWRRRT